MLTAMRRRRLISFWAMMIYLPMPLRFWCHCFHAIILLSDTRRAMPRYAAPRRRWQPPERHWCWWYTFEMMLILPTMSAIYWRDTYYYAAVDAPRHDFIRRWRFTRALAMPRHAMLRRFSFAFTPPFAAPLHIHTSLRDTRLSRLSRDAPWFLLLRAATLICRCATLFIWWQWLMMAPWLRWCRAARGKKIVPHDGSSSASSGSATAPPPAYALIDASRHRRAFMLRGAEACSRQAEAAPRKIRWRADADTTSCREFSRRGCSCAAFTLALRRFHYFAMIIIIASLLLPFHLPYHYWCHLRHDIFISLIMRFSFIICYWYFTYFIIISIAIVHTTLFSLYVAYALRWLKPRRFSMMIRAVIIFAPLMIFAIDMPPLAITRHDAMNIFMLSACRCDCLLPLIAADTPRAPYARAAMLPTCAIRRVCDFSAAVADIFLDMPSAMMLILFCLWYAVSPRYYYGAMLISFTYSFAIAYAIFRHCHFRDTPYAAPPVS